MSVWKKWGRIYASCLLTLHCVAITVSSYPLPPHLIHLRGPWVAYVRATYQAQSWTMFINADPYRELRVKVRFLDPKTGEEVELGGLMPGFRFEEGNLRSRVYHQRSLLESPGAKNRYFQRMCAIIEDQTEYQPEELTVDVHVLKLRPVHRLWVEDEAVDWEVINAGTQPCSG